MSRTRARLLIAAIALAHAAFFVAYQRPDWDTQWADQNGYLLLGRVLAATGRFTRFASTPTYIPETMRTPGYPAFVAALDRLFGESHLVIAVAQDALFALVCLLVHQLALGVASEGVALAAGIVVALYPPLPYYAALVLTETLATFLVTAGVAVWMSGLRRTSAVRCAASGIVFAAAALTRPTFALLPLFMAGAAFLARPRNRRSRWLEIGAMVAAFAASVAPWLVYNAIYFHALTFSPAGGPGRQLFEGSWQVAVPGRVETELTSLADTSTSGRDLDADVDRVAARTGLPAETLRRYVHEHLDIQRTWSGASEPRDKMFARIGADREYWRVGIENIRRDPVSYAWGRATRGMFLLWAAEIPVRYSDINRLPPWAIRAMWLPQVLLLACAAWGIVVLARNGARTEAWAFAAVLVYVTAVYGPLYSEARYSLPAKPAALLLATVAVTGVRPLSHRRATASDAN